MTPKYARNLRLKIGETYDLKELRLLAKDLGIDWEPLFGDEKPMTAAPGAKVGRSVARIDTETWTIHQLNLGKFNRPIDIQFHPITNAMYVLDFGQFEMKVKGMFAEKESGCLYEIPLEDILQKEAIDSIAAVK